MGLDQHLSARIEIEPSNPRYHQIYTFVAQTLAEEKEKYGKDAADFNPDQEVYVSGWEFSETSKDPMFDVLVETTGVTPTSESPSFTVGFAQRRQVGQRIFRLLAEPVVIYWRKANAVHQWFVDNVQHGEDDCGTYEVHPEVLADLYGKCQAVLADKSEHGARDLLPTQAGPFFGSTEYDQWYFDDLADTVKGLEELMKIAGKVETFLYHSSW